MVAGRAGVWSAGFGSVWSPLGFRARAKPLGLTLLRDRGITPKGVLRLLTDPVADPLAIALPRVSEKESEALREVDSSGCSILKLRPDSSLRSFAARLGGRARISSSLSSAAAAASASESAAGVVTGSRGVSSGAVAAAGPARPAVAGAGGVAVAAGVAAAGSRTSLQPATEEAVHCVA
jgi:hypothetical protein